jgi:hypothetical protein
VWGSPAHNKQNLVKVGQKVKRVTLAISGATGVTTNAPSLRSLEEPEAGQSNYVPGEVLMFGKK